MRVKPCKKKLPCLALPVALACPRAPANALGGEKKTQNGCVGKCRLTEGMTGTLFSIFFRVTERARETVREKERGGKLRLSVSLSHSERHRFFCSLTTSTPKQIRLLQSTVYSAYLPASASLCSRTSLSPPSLSPSRSLSPRLIPLIHPSFCQLQGSERG